MPSFRITEFSVSSCDVGPALQLDRAVGDQLGCADIDIIARAAPQIFHEQAGAVVAPIEHEAGLLQAFVKIRVALADRLIDRYLELVQDLVGQGGEDQVGLGGRHAGLDRLLGIERT